MNPADLSAIGRKKPLIHCISNIVTANDCANLLLAVGASPIMAQAPEEMRFISAKAQAVVLNTGTPSEEKFRACIEAGKTANQLGIPVVLDPVGIGASPWRLSHVAKLLEQVHPDLLRVNYGEACALLGNTSEEQGVDSLSSATELRNVVAQRLTKQMRCTVLLSGTEDIITNGEKALCVTGGSDWMRQITGAGCMLSVLCGAFIAVSETPFDAAAQASRLWKDVAAQAEVLSGGRGLGSYHMSLFDAVTQAAFSTR